MHQVNGFFIRANFLHASVCNTLLRIPIMYFSLMQSLFDCCCLVQIIIKTQNIKLENMVRPIHSINKIYFAWVVGKNVRESSFQIICFAMLKQRPRRRQLQDPGYIYYENLNFISFFSSIE